MSLAANLLVIAPGQTLQPKFPLSTSDLQQESHDPLGDRLHQKPEDHHHHFDPMADFRAAGGDGIAQERASDDTLDGKYVTSYTEVFVLGEQLEFSTTGMRL